MKAPGFSRGLFFALVVGEAMLDVLLRWWKGREGVEIPGCGWWGAFFFKKIR